MQLLQKGCKMIRGKESLMNHMTSPRNITVECELTLAANLKQLQLHETKNGKQRTLELSNVSNIKYAWMRKDPILGFTRGAHRFGENGFMSFTIQYENDFRFCLLR